MHTKTYQFKDLLVTVVQLDEQACPENTCFRAETCVNDTQCKTNTWSLTKDDFNEDSLLTQTMSKLAEIQTDLDE